MLTFLLLAFFGGPDIVQVHAPDPPTEARLVALEARVAFLESRLGVPSPVVAAPAPTAQPVTYYTATEAQPVYRERRGLFGGRFKGGKACRGGACGQ